MHSPQSHPLSPAQSGIWYAHQLDPASPAYHCLQYLDIQGTLDTALFTEAVRQATTEADGLHVRFEAGTGGPRQILLPTTAPEVPVHDLTAEPDPFAAALRWMRRRLLDPFDLESGRVGDCAVLELAPDRTLWVQRYHHIVTDGQMYNLITHRIAEIYRASAAGQPLPAARFQPLAEALQEAAGYRGSERYAADRAYWHQRFADRPEPLELTWAEGGTGIAHQVRRTDLTVTAEQHRALRAAAREAGTTSSRALIALLAGYAHRMSGREDVVVGLAAHGRRTPAAQRFPGMMSDVLPLRLRVGADTTWRELLADTEATVTGAMEHQGYRSEDLRQELGWPEHRRFAGPLVNLVPPLRPVDLGTASGTLHNLSIMPTEDFTLCCYRRPKGELQLTLDVHPDRCADTELAEHRERLATLLDALGSGSVHHPVSATDAIGPAERRRLLTECQPEPVPLPDASLGELFRRQAARTPDAVAVADGGTRLSYAELEARSERIAAQLDEHGVRPGSTVLVFMERSVDLLTVLLAVLKTGAAYVPLDERQPASRLRALLAQAGGDLLLVAGPTRELPLVREQAAAGLPVLDADTLAQAAPPLSPPPPRAVPAEAPACVMYTSGSTGVPSGVQITHRNITALALDRCWRGGAHHRVLWHSPHAFDAVLYELWVPLLSGGQVCVAPPGPLEPATVREMIARHRVTAAWLTAGLFAALAEEEPDCLRGLDEVWTGGDVVPPAAVARVFAHCPGITVVNGYGPTETTTFATRHRMTAPPAGPVPIGRAMDNTTLYVLDAQGAPVPSGAPGELWVGGAGVTAGYVNRPEATRERFRPNPFHPGRMYRTGDLVRYAPDGTLRFLGRADDQVKIRGFRVEPHDIETTLERHPEVARAVVLPQDTPGHGKRLVAYLVPAVREDAGAPGGRPAEGHGPDQADRTRVDEWQHVYEDMYREGDEAGLGEDFSGWTDSYLGTPIPREHMREWRDRTVERVLELRPRRVLEIGVGSGLLLARLAPHCAEYWGTDFSRRAIDRLRRKVCEAPDLADRVHLLHREARDLSGIPLHHFDCVVVNSVVQYLPSADYLAAALRGALGTLVPGGHLYVGDIRPQRLLRAFRTGVELRRSAPGRTPDELKRAVEQLLLHEKELLVEPEFFTEHLGSLPEVAGVDIRVKRGRRHNELTQFRYEAVLRTSPGTSPSTAPDTRPDSSADATSVRWGTDIDGLPALGRHLLAKRPAALRLTGVPNARVSPLLRAEREVCAGGDLATALDALDGAAPAATEPLPDPEDFAALGQGLGLHTILTWSHTAADGSLDILFLDPAAHPGGTGQEAPGFVADTYPRRPATGPDPTAQAFTNRPADREHQRELVPAVEAFARRQLPDYMLPAAYAVLDQLPLSVNGKVNRAELPPLEHPTAPDRPSIAPADQPQTTPDTATTATERELAAIWSDLLRVPVDAAARPDFFALGGHSLLATRLVSRIGSRLGAEISLRTVFEHPDLGSLARAVDRHRTPDAEEEQEPPASETLPVSGFQERIWLDERLRGFGSHYNTPLTWRIPGGGIDPGALSTALGRVVERHEVLRTRFVESPSGRPHQLVGEAWTPEVVHRTAEGATEESRLDHATAALREFARLPFDPDSGRLLRAMLVDLGAPDHDQLLLCCLHHLVWDIGSEPVFLRDLAAAYQEAAGPAAPAAYREWPATPHQQRMAFVEHFERGTVYPDAPVYHNATRLLTVDRVPERAALREAVAATVRRHPALRTTVHLDGESCVQRVHDSLPIHCTWLDEADGDAPERLADLLTRPFRLAEGPLLRVVARPDGGGGCTLALVAHLAVADRASLRTVAGELSTLLGGGQLPPAPPSFTQWWQARDTEEEERHTARLAELLDGGGEPLRLPVDRTRAAVHVYREQSLPIEVAKAAEVAAFAAREGVSAEAVLLAAYTAVLQWYSGQYDLTVGVSNPRRDADSAGVVGPVDDILPLRLRGTPEQSFASWAHTCQAGLTAVRACSLAPFDEVVRRVAPPKDMSRTALYDVVFDWEHGAAEEPIDPPVAGLGKCDLYLTLRSTARGITGRLLSNGLYYDPERPAAVAEHWQRLLDQALAAPGTPVGAFEPLTPRERRRQTEEWNDTAADYPETTLARLVAERARRQPHSTALADSAGSLSYQRLITRAGRLARTLADQGAAPGTLVALRLRRGPAQIEAIMAVLLAGAAYVPIDPAAPAERAAFILADSGARLLVTDGTDTAEGTPAADGPENTDGTENADATAGTPADDRTGTPAADRPAVFTGRTIRLDRMDLDAPGPATGDLPEAGPDDLAYVIYTSGTTGRPKGVRVTHRNVVRLVLNDRSPFDFGPRDVWLQAHSYAFDFSVWEIFGCLVHGGRLVLPEAEDLQDPERLAALVRARGVTVLNQTPGAFAQLTQVTRTPERRMDTLRYVILGGAAFRPATLGDWPAGHPAAQVVNMYGITETTVHVTARTITAEDIAGDRSPIGTPIPTTTVHLLDPVRTAGRHRMLPIGAVGEICVGGAGVAAGYLGRPELERERFRPDPSGAGRLYRSGDLGRYLPDGTLEYLGRLDDQLQVRGYRIEPGEVEACLLEHPDVAQAQVTADTEDGDRLVAHVWCPGSVPSAGELRTRLAERLPAYMVPSVFRVVDRVPLSVNGKIDRAALAASSTPLTDGAGGAPRTGTAEALAELWRELLPVPEVFAGTSFFEAGGHSLLAATLLARIRERFGAELPVRSVFENPRLQDLADRIDAAAARPGPAPAALAGRDDDLPGTLVPASDFQRRIALDEQLSGATDRYAMPLVWRVRGGRLDAARLRRALAAVVARHEALRTGFTEREGRLWQRIGPAWSPELTQVDLSALPPEERTDRWRGWVREIASTPFDLASGRLLRAGLMDLGDQGQMLVVCLHHLVGDGPSLAPLVRDMDAAYRGAALDAEVVQYREFVRGQEELAGSVAGAAGVER
ncbi:non-ribosomal peptide synthetase, partial [Streptomyces palmae]